MDWYPFVCSCYYATPSYFSDAYYGTPPYTYHCPVSVRLSTIQPFDAPKQSQTILISAHSLPLTDRTVHLFPADEKGTVDFAGVAFPVFVTHAESIFYLYLSLMAVSLVFLMV